VSAGQTYTVGAVLTTHPHTVAHLRTLDVIPEIEAIHVHWLDGTDPATLGPDVPLRKVVATHARLPDLLGVSGLDAAIVCVRTDGCPGVLRSALAADLPVLFEKPGALNAATLWDLAAEARQRSATVGTFLSWRGHPAVTHVRDAVGAGALGDLLGVEGRMVTSQVRYRDPSHWLFRRDMAGSGILSWLGCHFLDALCFMAGDTIAEVSAMVGKRNPEPIEVEDTACLAIRMRGGALGTFNAGYHLVGSVPGYMGAAYDTFLGLRGTRGHAQLPLSQGATAILVSEAPGWREGGRREWRFDLPASPAYHGVPGEEFVRRFLQDARTRVPAVAPIESIAHVLDVVEAAIRSSETGRATRVPEH
jgi:predicted dehydrogenase